jgi:hypothetical protein
VTGHVSPSASVPDCPLSAEGVSRYVAEQLQQHLPEPINRREGCVVGVIVRGEATRAGDVKVEKGQGWLRVTIRIDVHLRFHPAIAPVHFRLPVGLPWIQHVGFPLVPPVEGPSVADYRALAHTTISLRCVEIEAGSFRIRMGAVVVDLHGPRLSPDQVPGFPIVRGPIDGFVRHEVSQRATNVAEAALAQLYG